MQKKIIAIIVAILVIAVAVLAVVNHSNSEDRPGMIISAGGNETAVAWEDIDAKAFEGDIVNGKGETFHNTYEGAELSTILKDNGIVLADDDVVTVTSEDNYSAELTGSEILESGKVYVALTQDGEMIEGIEGGQGAQLIVFGDPNSKRAVRYMKTVSLDE